MAQELSFGPILAVAEFLRGFPVPWFVSGGWAIDLFLGQVTRPHGDIEIGMYRRDLFAIRPYFEGWQLERTFYDDKGSGGWMEWNEGDPIPLPAFQVKATRPDPEPHEIEFFLNESDDAHWLGRRQPGLSVPFETAAFPSSALGIPILSPELQLLHKAIRNEEKDKSDFEHALPPLDAARRERLAEWLDRYHPGHWWLTFLRPS